MIVTKDILSSALNYIRESKSPAAIDLETSGLRPYHGDFITGMSYYDGQNSFYFNVNPSEVGDASTVLEHTAIRDALLNINSQRVILGANFKFDMRFLKQVGITLPNRIYDVLVGARIQNNSYFKYSLDSCGERINIKKSVSVNDYLKKHKLWTKEYVPGKKSRQRVARFDLVPVEVLAPYAEQDCFIAYALYKNQAETYTDWNLSNPSKPILGLVRNEMALTKVCFNIEDRGILIDREYTSKALDYEMNRAHEYETLFNSISGQPLIDSPFALGPAFTRLGLTAGKTALGNESFTDDILSAMKHPLAESVLGYRDAKKKSGTYYSAFLYHADKNDVIHCNIRQSATATSRFSITEPALQTLSSEDSVGLGFKIRNCFIARERFSLVSIDYKAFEFRAMLDMAGETLLAKSIESGEDPHQATADLLGISRKQAKTINFGLLYGMGVGKLADSLGCSEEEAKSLKRLYFSKLPKVQNLIFLASRAAQNYGYVFNGFNRRYFFSDSKFSYKALNYLIQGGTADAVKHAMVKISDLLKNSQSHMILQIHDEILLEMHEDEMHLIPMIKDIMREAYPSRFHKMDVSESIGHRWGEL